VERIVGELWPRGGRSQVIVKFHGNPNGMFLGPEKRHTRGEFDYLDYEIDLSLPVPRNIGGVSGGGVWQVYVYWIPSGEGSAGLNFSGRDNRVN
jgi:hypothetical protein